MMRLVKIIAIICLSIYLVILLIPIVRDLRPELYVSRMPESIIELYFEDHQHLPTRISTDQTYSFQFTVYNRSNEDRVFPYEVYADTAEAKIRMDKNTIRLKKGEQKTITEEFGTMKDVPARSKIVVHLLNNNQFIAFWTEGRS